MYVCQTTHHYTKNFQTSFFWICVAKRHTHKQIYYYFLLQHINKFVSSSMCIDIFQIRLVGP